MSGCYYCLFLHWEDFCSLSAPVTIAMITEKISLLRTLSRKKKRKSERLEFVDNWRKRQIHCFRSWKLSLESSLCLTCMTGNYTAFWQRFRGNIFTRINCSCTIPFSVLSTNRHECIFLFYPSSLYLKRAYSSQY